MNTCAQISPRSESQLSPCATAVSGPTVERQLAQRGIHRVGGRVEQRRVANAVLFSCDRAGPLPAVRSRRAAASLLSTGTASIERAVSTTHTAGFLRHK